MDIKEAYRVMQAEWVRINDVRVGDEVRILRKYRNDELGFDGIGCDYTGREECISSIKKDYIYSIGGNHPFFVLEIVNQPRDKSKMIEVKGKKWSEDTIAEALKAHAND